MQPSDRTNRTHVTSGIGHRHERGGSASVLETQATPELSYEGVGYNRRVNTA